MKKILFGMSAAVIILMSIVTSCVSYPMGLSQQEWDSLSPEKKVEFRQKQAAIDEASRRQQAQERLERQKQAQQQQLEEQKLALQQQENTRQAYAQALHGDIVTVSIQGGTFEFARKWYSFDPIIFDLIRGESKTVELSNTHNQHSISESMEVRFTDDGNQIFFYSNIYGNPTSIMNDGSWKAGHRYGPMAMNNGNDNTGVRGAMVLVRFKPLPVKTQKFIIDQR